jgi:hypothetical protein
MEKYQFSGNIDYWLNNFFEPIKDEFDTQSHQFTFVSKEDLLDAVWSHFHPETPLADVGMSANFNFNGTREEWINNFLEPMLNYNDAPAGVSSVDIFNFLINNNMLESANARQAGGKRRKRKSRRKKTRRKKTRRKRKSRKKRKTRKMKRKR